MGNACQIKEANCMNEVFTLIDNFLKNKKSACWIAFDVDYTLTMPALNYDNTEIPISKENFVQVFPAMQCKTKEDVDVALTSTLFSPQLLVDQDAPKIIKELQKQNNVTVFALTSCLYTKKIAKLRFDTLNSLGINFQNAFDISDVVLDEIPMYHQNFPTYYNGIICVNGENGPHNKGTVLQAFMKKIQKTPQVFVIIDDRKKNIEDLQNIFSKEYPEVSFFGILYHPKSSSIQIPSKILEEQVLKVINQASLD